jgi:hypothetical protein
MMTVLKKLKAIEAFRFSWKGLQRPPLPRPSRPQLKIAIPEIGESNWLGR